MDVIGLHQVINVMAYDVDVTSGMSWHKYMVTWWWFPNDDSWWLMIFWARILALHVLTWHSNFWAPLPSEGSWTSSKELAEFANKGPGWCGWVGWGQAAPKMQKKGHVHPHPHLSSHQVGRKCWCPRQNLREIFETRRWFQIYIYIYRSTHIIYIYRHIIGRIHINNSYRKPREKMFQNLVDRYVNQNCWKHIDGSNRQIGLRELAHCGHQSLRSGRCHSLTGFQTCDGSWIGFEMTHVL